MLLAQAALVEARTPLADKKAVAVILGSVPGPPAMWPVEAMMGDNFGHSKILHRSQRRGRVGKRRQSQF